MINTLKEKVKSTVTGQYLSTLNAVYQEKGLVDAVKHEVHSTLLSLKAKSKVAHMAIDALFEMLPDQFGVYYSDRVDSNLTEMVQVVKDTRRYITNRNLLEDMTKPDYFPQPKSADSTAWAELF